MKKFFCMVLSLIIFASLLVSCGNNVAPSTSDASTSGESEIAGSNESATDPGSVDADNVDYTRPLGDWDPEPGSHCNVHPEEYHVYFYPDRFINSRVSAKDLTDWYDMAQEKNKAMVDPETGVDEYGCKYPYATLWNMVRDLGYTREEIDEACMSDPSVPLTINSDLLFGDDPVAFEGYYHRNHNEILLSKLRQTVLMQEKFFIAKILKLDNREDDEYWSTLSMIEIVRDYDIAKEDFEWAFEVARKYYGTPNPNAPNINADPSYPYDFSTLYGENAVDPDAEVDGRKLNTIELDSLFCGVDDIRVY